ncbi:MAG: Ig domain-containing protein [Balneolaceae bacterium]|nr:Ig domain-containing protein [Balneolaceae bacterium]
MKKDLSFVMEIPSVVAMESSLAHLYVLSRSEGMVVFRTVPDTLQWLYSSTGMDQRGNAISADIRFAYLYGYNRRLTILEPTSVLGVYSSTLLPEKPLDAERIGNYLYVAMGAGGLGRLSLETPSTVDTPVERVEKGRLNDQEIIDLESSQSQLFALSSDDHLYVFGKDNQEVQLSEVFDLTNSLQHIFLVGEVLLGSDESGNIFEIDGSGVLNRLGSVDGPVKQIESWRDWLIIRDAENRLWTSYRNRSPELWKNDGKAGNQFTVNKGTFWLFEYNKLSRIVSAPAAQNSSNTEENPVPEQMKLQPVKDQIIPYPKPLLLSIGFRDDYPIDQVQLVYQSPSVDNAEIRGNGLHWQPSADDVGTHRFKIIATASDGQVDSTRFAVDVRSFNAPPRFAPLRPVTIPVGEEFTLPVKAVDPDGMDQNLVRYLGVDLPEGASLSEKSGTFTWTPEARQTGKNSFRVIATDQYGAASSVEVTLRVIEAKRGE